MAVASGTFDVRLAPIESTQDPEGTNRGRLSIEKSYHGDLEGTATGEMMTARTAVESSAGYVAIERVSGTLNGRRGSFLLQHSGIMGRGAQELAVRVVPDSGTGELEGLSGRMGIVIEADGTHSYELDFTLKGASEEVPESAS